MRLRRCIGAAFSFVAIATRDHAMAATPKTPPAKRKRSKKPRRPKIDAATIDAIFSRFQAANPEPEGELNYVNGFTLLVAVVLSAQATDSGVNKATKALFEIADSPEKMAGLGVARL